MSSPVERNKIMKIDINKVFIIYSSMTMHLQESILNFR